MVFSVCSQLAVITMKLFKYLLLLTGCLAFISCKEGSASAASGGSGPQGKVAKHLAALDYNYGEMLTEEDVRKIAELDASTEIEKTQEDNKATGSPEYGHCVYEWASDRPDVRINPQFPPQPDLNSVRISNLAVDDDDPKKVLSRFETAYRPMTKEQIDASIARLEESFKDKPADQLETAKGFIEARGKSKYQHVEGIGDSAYWATSKVMDLYLGSELIVLTGNAQFKITAKVSADDQENLKVAKEAAKAVIAKAK